MLQDLSSRFYHGQRAQIWLAAITLLLVMGALAVCIVAVVKANHFANEMDAAFALLLGSSSGSQDQEAQQSSCSFEVTQSTWLVVGDAFLSNHSWPRPVIEATDETASLASLLDRASTQVQDQSAAGQPFLILLSYGYQALLSRQEGVDDLYSEVVSALGSHPELFSSPDTLVLLFKRPLPATHFVPADRQDCSSVQGGSVFNVPSSVEQSMMLPEGASLLSIEALQYALLAYPPAVQVVDPPGLVADSRCVYLSPEQSSLLDAYLAPCLSGNAGAPSR